MLKIRYNLETGLLSGWDSKKLPVRDGEAVALLDIEKPDSDDYEYFAFIEGQLVPSGKEEEPEPPRDPLAEIDEIKAKIADYDTLKAKVEALEKK